MVSWRNGYQNANGFNLAVFGEGNLQISGFGIRHDVSDPYDVKKKEGYKAIW
jgi:hypothetical protein